jgi:hypothetical protein
MRVLAATILYFLWSMAAGFMLGMLRELLFVPAFGYAAGNLVEAALMLLAIVAGAASITKWLGVPSATSPRIVMGVCSFVLVLAAEAALSPIVHGSFQAWLANFTHFTIAIAFGLWAAQAVAPALVLLAAADGEG